MVLPVNCILDPTNAWLNSDNVSKSTTIDNNDSRVTITFTASPDAEYTFTYLKNDPNLDYSSENFWKINADWMN